tara:strand:+ start:269 stop:703 length:435 start_codon:yes stop_codon:yes gene_type:complete
VAVNAQYSYKDFTGVDLSGEPAGDFNDSEIIGSCFAQESEYSEDASHSGGDHTDPCVSIFPAGMHGVTFTRCNLDNVKIEGNVTVGDRCSHRTIRVMNDLEDWVLKSNHEPNEPINKKKFEKMGLSVDPADIPLVKRETPVTSG